MSMVKCEECNKSFEFNNSDGYLIGDKYYCSDCYSEDILSHECNMYYEQSKNLYEKLVIAKDALKDIEENADTYKNDDGFFRKKSKEALEKIDENN